MLWDPVRWWSEGDIIKPIDEAEQRDPSAAEGVFTQSLWGQNMLWDSLHPGWEALGQLPLTRPKCLYRLLLFTNTGAGNGNPLRFLAWKVLWTERPGGLQSTGSQSHTQLWDWAIFIALPVSPVPIHIIYQKGPKGHFWPNQFNSVQNRPSCLLNPLEILVGRTPREGQEGWGSGWDGRGGDRGTWRSFQQELFAKQQGSYFSILTTHCLSWCVWKSLSHVWLFATPWTICPWNSPGHDTGVGSPSLLQGVFPTQRLNPGLPHCRQILYQLSHKGSWPVLVLIQ